MNRRQFIKAIAATAVTLAVIPILPNEPQRYGMTVVIPYRVWDDLTVRSDIYERARRAMEYAGAHGVAFATDRRPMERMVYLYVSGVGL